MRLRRLIALSVVLLAMSPALLKAATNEVIEQNFANSLHKTRIGKTYCYSEENGGFETLTKIKMEQLGCLNCHPQTYADGSKVEQTTYEPGCKDCHDFSKGNGVPQEQCLQCHSRQTVEIKKLKLADVHRDKNLSCMDCHTQEEMHGDGNVYVSKLQTGAIKINCEKCHEKMASVQAHDTHNKTVACTSCHNQTVITCFNCHFESLVEAKEKRPYGLLKDFMLLVKRQSDGKIAPATFFVLTYQGKSFYSIAPYASHSVMQKARECGACHGTETVNKILKGEEIRLTTWDEKERKMQNYQGVIPVPSNWKEILGMDYLTYSGDTHAKTESSQWQFLKSTTDLSQMLFSSPLSKEEMEKLAEKH